MNEILVAADFSLRESAQLVAAGFSLRKQRNPKVAATDCDICSASRSQQYRMGFTELLR